MKSDRLNIRPPLSGKRSLEFSTTNKTKPMNKKIKTSEMKEQEQSQPATGILASPLPLPIVCHHPYRIGGLYFIRTVTHHHTGQLVEVTGQELVLERAAWIADDGRFTQALEKGEFSEVEMFPVGSRVIIGRGSVIDAVEIQHLPTSQK